MTSSGSAASAGAAVPSKPKILLVDDHPDVLTSLSRLLSLDFEVVGTATSGVQALDASTRVPPDVVVMDISMPGRDGFQTARDLKQNGSTAPIVFLTMHDSEDFIAEGFRSGGRGYVIKTRLHEDLVTAVERVLSGQMFVPSLNSLYVINQRPGAHVVQFHADDHACLASVATFTNKALRRGDAVSAVLSGSLRAGLATRLQSYGWTVGQLGDYGPYRATDSADAAAAILHDGLPDAQRVSEAVADLERFRLATNGGRASRLIVVGDIATHFVSKGNLEAAVELERLWTALTHALPFLTVCCYPLAFFSDGVQGHRLPQLCAEHHTVAHASDGGTRSLHV